MNSVLDSADKRFAWSFIETCIRDLRYAFRSLRRSWGFSLAIILTLTLCIGANLTILSTLYGLVLKPLPFPHPDRLVEIYTSFPKTGQPKRMVSVAHYADFKAHADLFEGFALWRVWTFNIGEDADPTRGIGARVSPDVFKLLDLQPVAGRFFTFEECRPGADAVVVLTESYWESHYHRDAAVVGKTIRLGGEPFTIIGVAPRSMEALNRDGVMYKPFEWTDDDAPNARFRQGGLLYARLKPGVSFSVGLAQLSSLEKTFYDQSASPPIREYLDRGGYRLALGGIRAEQTKTITTSLVLLQSGAFFVLLLGCVNVANLMLARANARQGELCIRQALGASRYALARRWLIESIQLSAVSALLGLAIAWAVVRVINTYSADIVREAPPIAIDSTLVGITFGVAAIVALFIGLVPVLRIAQMNVSGSLQSGARGASASRGVRAMSGILVTTQVALALVLLVGACLLIRSFAAVLAVDPGFRVDHMFHGRVAFNANYSDTPSIRAAYAKIMANLREIPGVQSICATNLIPVGSLPMGTFPIRGSTLGASDTFPSALVLTVSPEFFETFGIRLLEGRAFNEADAEAPRRVFIVDRRFAEKYFPHQSAVGQQFGNPGPNDKPDAVPTIVGVCEAAKLSGPEDRTGLPFVFLPLTPYGGFSITARSTRAPTDLRNAMRQAVHRFDPTLPLYQEFTLDEAMDSLVANRRGVMMLLAAFAVIALVLSAIGIFGMLAYDVTQRTREIGIRGAIGASRQQIIAMVLRQGLWKTGIGLLIGLAGALYLAHLMRSMLFDVSAADPLVFVGVALLLLLVGAVASYLPARRASKIDPIVALRSE